MTTYDVHAHCIPDQLVELLRHDGARFGMDLVTGDRGDSVILSNGRKIGPLRSTLGDMERRLAHMDATGVDVQLISSWIDLTAYQTEPKQGAAYSRRFNEILTEETSRHPDRFLALGTVPLQNPHVAAEELHHAVRDLGMVGVEVATTVGGVDLDQAELEPFWEAAQALKCLILVHPLDPLGGVDLSRSFLDNMIGNPAESSIAIGHLVFSGILERYPELVICVVHGGGFIPYQLGRMERGYRAVPHLTAARVSTPPDELVRRLYFDTVLHDPSAIAFLVERIGVERVVLGTDYPFEMGDPDPISTLESVPGLSESDRLSIRQDNVRRILAGIRR